MKPMLLLLLAISLGAGTADAQLWNAESRWRFVSEHGDVGDVQGYLFEYPDSAHTAEARARLAAFDNQPLGRMTTPTCAATVQARAESLLAGAHRPERLANYALAVPAGHFLASPTLVLVPRGQTPETTPIEQHITLNLVATQTGGCTLMQRWSTGSGLPDECRCEPLASGHVFDSALARSILGEHAQLQTANAFCVARGAPDLDASIEAFLAESVAARVARADSIRRREAAGTFLLPTERGELEDLDHALPVLAARPAQPEAQAAQAAGLGNMTPEQLDGLCAGRLADRIIQARTGLLMIRPIPE